VISSRRFDPLCGRGYKAGGFVPRRPRKRRPSHAQMTLSADAAQHRLKEMERGKGAAHVPIRACGFLACDEAVHIAMEELHAEYEECQERYHAEYEECQERQKQFATAGGPHRRVKQPQPGRYTGTFSPYRMSSGSIRCVQVDRRSAKNDRKDIEEAIQATWSIDQARRSPAFQQTGKENGPMNAATRTPKTKTKPQCTSVCGHGEEEDPFGGRKGQVRIPKDSFCARLLSRKPNFQVKVLRTV
jgi:hypothetical protein